MGQVIQAGAGENPPHRGHRRPGCRCRVPSITINKVCLTGINADRHRRPAIRAGEHEIIVAGGIESMTNAPHLLPKSREGFEVRRHHAVDSMAYDAL